MAISETEANFHRWVIVSIQALRAIPKGDGAFAALAIAFGLYERYIISQLNASGMSDSPADRHKFASADFGGKVSPSDFQDFWDMYRVGIQHSFQPKNFVKGKDKSHWGWEISEEKGFHEYPETIQVAPYKYCIVIDPWKFIDHVLNRWAQSQAFINQVHKFALGTIRTFAPQPVQQYWLPPTGGGSGIIP